MKECWLDQGHCASIQSRFLHLWLLEISEMVYLVWSGILMGPIPSNRGYNHSPVVPWKVGGCTKLYQQTWEKTLQSDVIAIDHVLFFMQGSRFLTLKNIFTLRQGNSKCKKKTSQRFSRVPWQCPHWRIVLWLFRQEREFLLLLISCNYAWQKWFFLLGR